MIKMYFKPNLKRLKKKLCARFFFSPNKRTVRICKAVCIFCAVAVIFSVADSKITPIIKKHIGNEIENLISSILDNAVYDVINGKNITYDNLVEIKTDNNGKVTSLTANAYYINKLKSEIAKSVNDYIEGNKKTVMSVALGDLFDFQMFSGKGFKINVNVFLHSFNETDFKSTFKSVGLNQTLHRIYIVAEATSYSYIGPLKIEKTASTDVLVAETVIVGNVPETYRLQ